MADTTGEQLRVAIVEVGVAKYKVTTSVLASGDLPDQGAFLVEILETADPKRDKLARVCEVADLFEWSLNRNTALINGDPYYRAFTWTEYYSNITNAINAKDFFQESINNLVTAYQDYLTLFLADPAEALTWPTPNLGVLTPLINSYNTKVQEVAAQQEVVTEKIAECAEIDLDLTAAQTSASVAADALLVVDDAIAGLEQAQAAMSTFEADSLTIQPGLELVFAAWDAEDPGVGVTLLEAQLEIGSGLRGNTEGASGWFVDLITFSNALATLNAKKMAIDNQRVTLNGQKTAADALVTTLTTSKATCAAELAAEQATLLELEAQRDALLTQILALCPDFTP